MMKLETAVLVHIRMFRMTTAKALGRVCSLSAPADAEEVLEYLRRLGFIDRAMLVGEEQYYFLLPRAAEVLHVAQVLSGPVNGTPKLEAYATLSFCCLSSVYRPLIDTETLQKRFPTLYRTGVKINYYTEGAKFGHIRVDTKENTRGHPARTIDRCYKDISTRRRHKEKGRTKKDDKWIDCQPFIELHDSGRFVIAVLTAFPEKADRLRSELNRMTERHRQFRVSKRKREKGEFVNEDIYREYRKLDRRDQPPRLPPPVEVHVIPGLFDLMYPKPTNALEE